MAEGKTIEDLTREWQGVADRFKGALTTDAERLLRIVADALTIKMNNIMPWYATIHVVGSDTTEEKVYSQKVRPGQLVVLTHVSAVDEDSKKTTKIAVERGGESLMLKKDTPSATGLSIDFDGQVILSENDRVQASFFSISSGDKCALYCSGYEIKA